MKNFKNLQEWRTDDVDGDCINFNLYRLTENSILLFENGEEISEKKRTAKFINNFFFDELTQIEWSTEKQSNGKAIKTKNGRQGTSFWLLFEFGTNAKSRFIRILFNQVYKFNLFRLFFISIYKENSKHLYILVIFFYWFEIEQIKKVLIEKV